MIPVNFCILTGVRYLNVDYQIKRYMIFDIIVLMLYCCCQVNFLKLT